MDAEEGDNDDNRNLVSSKFIQKTFLAINKDVYEFSIKTETPFSHEKPLSI